MKRHWLWQRRFGRVQVALTVYRHVYVSSPDRWIVQPRLIYDRKERKDQQPKVVADDQEILFGGLLLSTDTAGMPLWYRLLHERDRD